MPTKKKPIAAESKSTAPPPIFDREEGNMDPGISLPPAFNGAGDSATRLEDTEESVTPPENAA